MKPILIRSTLEIMCFTVTAICFISSLNDIESSG